MVLAWPRKGRTSKPSSRQSRKLAKTRLAMMTKSTSKGNVLPSFSSSKPESAYSRAALFMKKERLREPVEPQNDMLIAPRKKLPSTRILLNY